MERLKMLEGANSANPLDIMEAINVTRTAANAIMEENDVLVERVAKLESDLDLANKRLDTTQKAAMKAVEQIALHTHDTLGRASMPLAV